jgi:hypothetical protein
MNERIVIELWDRDTLYSECKPFALELTEFLRAALQREKNSNDVASLKITELFSPKKALMPRFPGPDVSKSIINNTCPKADACPLFDEMSSNALLEDTASLDGELCNAMSAITLNAADDPDRIYDTPANIRTPGAASLCDDEDTMTDNSITGLNDTSLGESETLGTGITVDLHSMIFEESFLTSTQMPAIALAGTDFGIDEAAGNTDGNIHSGVGEISKEEPLHSQSCSSLNKALSFHDEQLDLESISNQGGVTSNSANRIDDSTSAIFNCENNISFVNMSEQSEACRECPSQSLPATDNLVTKRTPSVQNKTHSFVSQSTSVVSSSIVRQMLLNPSDEKSQHTATTLLSPVGQTKSSSGTRSKTPAFEHFFSSHRVGGASIPPSPPNVDREGALRSAPSPSVALESNSSSSLLMAPGSGKMGGLAYAMSPPLVSTNSDVWSSEEVAALEVLIARFTGANGRIAWGRMEAHLRETPHPFTPSHIPKERLRSKYKNMQRANGNSLQKGCLVGDA